MKKFTFIFIACALVLSACACGKNAPKADENTPETPVEQEKTFDLDSYNGHFVEALSAAYDTFEETGKLPNSINVDGITVTKGRYIIGACLLLEKIQKEPETWQDNDIETFQAAAGDEYRWNTFDPDVIDFQHINFMAQRLMSFTLERKSLPNYVTFPSDDPQNPGYLPQLTMVVTKHDNLMNLRACAVVLARTFNFFVENKGEWPTEVSSWPSSYLRATSNCPIDAPEVLAARDEAIAGLPANATDRQKAEAIYEYARDKWEWENYANTKKGAVGTIKAKGGNCCDLTHATLAMCRATGIPARYLHGQCYYSSVEGHVIPEIYVDGKWWIADPTNNDSTWGTPKWKGMETFNGRYYELEF